MYLPDYAFPRSLHSPYDLITESRATQNRDLMHDIDWAKGTPTTN
jgi:hypothetical protein